MSRKYENIYRLDTDSVHPLSTSPKAGTSLYATLYGWWSSYPLSSRYLVGLAVWGPFSMTYFSVYEQMKKSLAQIQLMSSRPSKAFSETELLAGIIAGGAGAAVTQPLDFIKTRIQVGQQIATSKVVDVGDSSHSRPGIVNLTFNALRNEGPGVFFRGVVARSLWLAPGCGITIAVFETIVRLNSRDLK